jgi:hypothetical protein
MSAAESALIRMREKRFYLITALLFPLVILIGFGRTYYLKSFTGAPPLSSYLVQIHGAIMTMWVVLYVAQVYLVRSKQIRLHQTLGFAGIGLAVLIVFSGFFTAIAAAKNGPSTPGPPDIPRMSFLAVPLFDLVTFAVLFTAAVYYRKRAANHKRLMLLIAIGLLPPALARFPINGIQSLGPLFFFGVPTLLMIFAIVYDRLQNGKFNMVLIYASLFLIASYPLRILFSGTDTWLAFAYWVITFAPV